MRIIFMGTPDFAVPSLERLVRDGHYESNIRGVYPCGEGAGYAGGILSAAADGMRCAEKILEVYR